MTALNFTLIYDKVVGFLGSLSVMKKLNIIKASNYIIGAHVQKMGYEWPSMLKGVITMTN